MNKKTAQLKPPNWDPDILPKLKQINYGSQEGEIKRILNDPSKIIFDATSPSDNPNASAWVTTDDLKDGKIDAVHINATKIPKPGDGFEQMANQIIASISALLSHEVGHIEDFREELYESGQDPFPGGEAVAEEAQRQQEQRAMLALEQMASAKSTLVKLSNDLDGSGNGKIADSIDKLLYVISKEEVSINKTAIQKDDDVLAEEVFMFNDSFYKKPFGRM